MTLLEFRLSIESDFSDERQNNSFVTSDSESGELATFQRQPKHFLRKSQN
jgi:hypothetical protein